ncbi:MAG TPA: 4a-hydroxytetrahydrobiopterin dehydratase, partial [bacterium]|nr:4a-hydroxytetrahydrobiopterin dehydratase [bacterium]
RRCTPRARRLSAADTARYLREIDGWRVEGNRITRTITFADFATTMRFVNAVARIAERENHHPDFTVRCATIDLTLTTHDAGGLSENDFIVAAKIDRAAERAGLFD